MAIAFLTFLYILTLWKDLKRYMFLRRELVKIEKRCEVLREENRRLKEEKEKLEKDKNYLEYLIRKELGWVKKDEIILVISENSTAGGP